MKKIVIYDTTLRDGAQGEGVSFSDGGRIRIARRLDEFGADFIEGGFAGSNPKDMAFFRHIRKEKLHHAKVVAFGATRRVGLRVKKDAGVESLLRAGTPAVAIVGKSWSLHVRDVLRTSLAENLDMIRETIAVMKDHGRIVMFDAEHFFDGYKTDPQMAMDTVRAAVEAGADGIVLCDTNGGCLPSQIYQITHDVAGSIRVPIGVHVHNDMGLAVANSIEAVRAGATQVQGTINGYGERCGNANLCSVIPTLQLKMGLRCVSDTALPKLRELSQFVDEVMNLRSDPKAPYVGQSAFSHKAGQHINAVQKNPQTCEHIPPEQVGNQRRFLVSDLAGGSGVLMKAVELGLGHRESAEGVHEILKALKDLESKGYAFEAADASMKILIQKVLKKHRSFFDLEGFRVIVEKRGKDQPCLAEAAIKVRVNDRVEHTAAEGEGPVNALDRALRKALTRFYPAIGKVFLTDFRVRILDSQEATAAKTRVTIESSDGKDTWGTVGVSGNIIEASWEALVDSVEYQLFREEEKARRRTRKR